MPNFRSIHSELIANLRGRDEWHRKIIKGHIWLIIRCARSRVPGRSDGYCDGERRVIWVSSDLSTKHQVNSINHEVYHAVSEDYGEVVAGPMGKASSEISDVLGLLRD